MKYISFQEACELAVAGDSKVWYRESKEGNDRFRPFVNMSLRIDNLHRVLSYQFYVGVMDKYELPLFSGIEELPEDPKTVLVTPSIISATGWTRIKWNKHSTYIQRLLKEGLLYIDEIEAQRVALHLRSKINLSPVVME
jgi:hypothetical protein